MAEIIKNFTMAAFGFIAIHIGLIHFLYPVENSSSSARPESVYDHNQMLSTWSDAPDLSILSITIPEHTFSLYCFYYRTRADHMLCLHARASALSLPRRRGTHTVVNNEQQKNRFQNTVTRTANTLFSGDQRVWSRGMHARAACSIKWDRIMVFLKRSLRYDRYLGMGCC
jgi:hypothetical protein